MYLDVAMWVTVEQELLLGMSRQHIEHLAARRRQLRPVELPGSHDVVDLANQHTHLRIPPKSEATCTRCTQTTTYVYAWV